MLKNKKGFTLAELIIVLLFIGVLATMAIPGYRTSTTKAKIVNNMTLMRALQNDIVNYYNLHGALPDNILQLSLNKDELSNITTRSAVHTPTRCTLTLRGGGSGSLVRDTDIQMNCNTGWTMTYKIESTSYGYKTGDRIFHVSGGDAGRLSKIANELGWQSSGSNSYKIK
jgi:prepilin-type N-terminal cleavage/methylation domain-containing protein